MVYGIFAMVLAFIWGQAGILSFGQAIFFGIGGYCMGLVTLGQLPSSATARSWGCSWWWWWCHQLPPMCWAASFSMDAAECERANYQSLPKTLVAPLQRDLENDIGNAKRARILDCDTSLITLAASGRFNLDCCPNDSPRSKVGLTSSASMAAREVLLDTTYNGGYIASGITVRDGWPHTRTRLVRAGDRGAILIFERPRLRYIQ
jgi:Branched-chain amino acid transport system / permease component